MAVLLYQIGIFLAIQIAAIFGKNSRNTAVILISIFTVLQVFMSWLLLLQFITIIVSYIISNNLFFTKSNTGIELEKKDDELVSYRTKNGGRALMTKSDFEELKRKEKEQEQIYYQKNKEEFDEFEKKTDKEKLEIYRKILNEMKGE